MYRAIAKFHKFKGQCVQAVFFAKEYKSLKRAENFVESQKNHSKFYFEIQEKEKDCSPVSWPQEA